MLNCNATVEAVNTGAGDHPNDQSALFRAVPPAACSGCAKLHGCGMQLLDQLSAGDSPGRLGPVSLSASSLQQPLRVGQSVRISLPGALLLRWTALMYLLPLIVSTAVAVMLDTWGVPEGWVVAGFLSGLVAAFAALKLLQRLSSSFHNPLRFLRFEPGVMS